MIISLIAAIGENNVIGVDGDLPWNLPDDMKFFSRTTQGHHVLMGRKNFESIPEKYRPLPKRPNIVVTRREDYEAPGADVVNDIKRGIELARERGEEELFIIGGGDIYAQTLDLADRLYITHVKTSIEGHAYFPEFDPSAWDIKVLEEHPKDAVHNFPFRICLYSK